MNETRKIHQLFDSFFRIMLQVQELRVEIDRLVSDENLKKDLLADASEMNRLVAEITKKLGENRNELTFVMNTPQVKKALSVVQ